MSGLNRILSRRALTLVSDPAAWQALAAEQAWRLRGPCPPACNARQSTHATTTIYWRSAGQRLSLERSSSRMAPLALEVSAAVGVLPNAD
jgi:hypothetical protein